MNTHQLLLPYETYRPSVADAPDFLIDELTFRAPAQSLGAGSKVVSRAWNSLNEGSESFFDAIQTLTESNINLELLDGAPYLGYEFTSDFYQLPKDEQIKLKETMETVKGKRCIGRMKPELWAGRGLLSHNVLMYCVEMSEGMLGAELGIRGSGSVRYARAVSRFVDELRQYESESRSH